MRITLLDSLPLRVKLAALPVILLAALSLVVIEVATGIQTQREEATLINAAGRQRMLNQRYVKEIMYAASRSDRPEQPAYQKTRELFMGSLKALTDGGMLIVNPGKGSTQKISAARDPLLITTLALNHRLATELDIMARDYLESTQKARAVKIGPLLDLNADLHTEANRAVQLFVKQSNDAIDALIRNCLFISLLAALLAIGVSYTISRSIAHPIDLFRDRLKQAARGDLSKQDTLPRTDEFGQMWADLDNTLSAVRRALGASQVDWEEVATLFTDMKEDLQSTRAIVTQVPTAMMIVDKGGMITYMNPQAQKNTRSFAEKDDALALMDSGEYLSQPNNGYQGLWQLCESMGSDPLRQITQIGADHIDLSIQTLLTDESGAKGRLFCWRTVTDDVERQKTLELSERKDAAKSFALKCLINDLRVSLQAASEGDFSQPLALGEDEELNDIVVTVNQFMQHTHQDMSSIKHRTRALIKAAEQLSANADALDDNTRESHQKTISIDSATDDVADYMTLASTATHQMNTSIVNICNTTTNAEHITQKAVELTNDAAVTVTKLFESSNNIGNIINFITSIAEQTNLLALNATIEAARAGDAGKGFAVVANEVKELAKQTATATDEIGDSISVIQSDSKCAVQSINDINDIVDKITELQSTIDSAVTQQTEVARELNHTIDQTAQSSAQIGVYVKNLVDQNETGVQRLNQSRDAIAQVVRCSQQLEEVLSHYQLEPGHVQSVEAIS